MTLNNHDVVGRFAVVLCCALVFGGCSSGDGGSNSDPIVREYLNSFSVFPSQPQGYDFSILSLSSSTNEVTYSWEQLPSSGVGDLRADTDDAVGVSFIAPLSNSVLTVRFRVTATLPDGSSGSREVSVDIQPNLDCPRCDAEDIAAMNNYVSVFGAKETSVEGSESAVADFEVLTDSLIFSNGPDQSLVEVSLSDGTELRRIPTDFRPIAMTYLAASNTLYVGLQDQTGLLGVNLANAVSTILATSVKPVGLYSGNNTLYFQGEEFEFGPKRLHSLDLSSSTESVVIDQALGVSDLVYNPVADEVITLDFGGIEVVRYRRNETGVFEMANRYEDRVIDSIGQIALSNDGQHLSFGSVGKVTEFSVDDINLDPDAGPLDTYIVDYSPTDLNIENGRYELGENGFGGGRAVYSNDSSLFVVNSSDTMWVFSVATREILARLPTPTCVDEQQSFVNSEVEDVRFSPNDDYMVLKLDCDFDTHHEFFVMSTPPVFRSN